MNYLVSDDQAALLDGLSRMLVREAGPARAMALGAGAYDHALHTLLADNGFFQVARDPDAGPLEAALVVEAVAAAGGVVASAAAALVVPALLDADPSGPVALAERGASELVRFASVATTVLGLDGDDAVLIELHVGEVADVRSTFGAPVGRITEAHWARAQRIGEGMGDKLRRWWRVAIAVEQAGLLASALNVTVGHVKQRVQFGHSIASFQAVRHRLAECAVLIEGARWLALEAAALGAPAESAAAACSAATAAARHVAAETHQLSGAIGFTKEHPLHVYTMWAQGLTLELGGLEAHRRALSNARWGGTA